MSFVKKFNLYTLLALLATSVGLPVNTASAAPGTPSDYPLFLANSAEANVFFMVDDSGSMDIEMMTPESVFGWGGAMQLDPAATGSFDSGIYIYLFGTGVVGTDDPDNYISWNGTTAANTYENEFILPTQAFINATYPSAGQTPEQRGVWRGRNSDYNKLYYDPTREYLPWIGVDNAGNPYKDYKDKGPLGTDPPVTVVPVDPYYAGGATYDLITSATIPIDRIDGTDDGMALYPASYWVWEDTDGDGNVDGNILDDNHGRVVIQPTNIRCAVGGFSATKAYQITNGCMLRTYDEEIRNFANWFVYHRKRDYEAKYAMSRVIVPEEKVRMGMATINDQGAAEIQLASMDLDYTTGNKAALLNSLFQMNSTGGTPLRRALQRTGNYFACSGTTPFGNGTCALQTSPLRAGESPPGACQQNFAVLISDGERSTGGGDDNLYAAASIGNDDGDASTFSGDYYPDGVLTTITNFNFAGEPYADTITDTLADVAMHFYERDLNTTLENRVPITCGVDENPAQHMVTFAVGFGVSGAVDLTNLPSHPSRGYPTNCTVPVTPPADFNWTTTATAWNNFTGPEKIDDMVHAAFNGRGEYYAADNPDALSTSLSGAIQSINNRSASSASAAFNAAVISSTTQIYLTRFHSGSWSGTLQAYGLNADGSLGSLAWDTETIMNDPSLFPYTDRAIATFDPSTDAGIPFVWGSLTATQQADLKKNPSGSETAPATFPIANARLDFIRGDQTCEQDSLASCPGSVGKIFRSRVSIMGDMVNSTPVFVGPPVGDYPNTAPFGTGAETYSSFKFGQTGSNGAFNNAADNALNRTPMVYVGGNDGMMHAFIADSSADAGKELWAFIPNSVFSNANDRGLHELTETNYEHKYYVDLTPTIIDVYADIDGDTDDDWHTVLVGGLRGGGAGLFAIDVTDPDYIRAAGMANGSARETRLAQKVMWEFTAADDPDLGQTFSEPAVVPLGTSSGIEWYVVVGNGYESTNTTGTGGANDGNPFASKLFLIKLEGPGADGVWDIGTDYYKMDSEFPSGTSVAAAGRNGMSSPALADNDGDGIFDRAYAGDILGKMWAFDLTGSAANNNQGWSFAYASGGNPAPLFTASGGDAGAGTRQAITMRPALGRHPTVATVSSGGGNNEPNIMVYFGTGQYLVSTDLTNTDTQSFYAVWDRGDDSLTVNRSTPGAASNNLQKQTIVETTLGTNNVRYIDPDTNGDGTVDSSDAIDYTTDPMHGWYIDQPTPGERSIFNPLLRGGIVFFNTLIPSQDPCGFGGSGWIMAVNQNDGKSPSDPLFDADGDGYINAGDTVGGTAIIGLQVKGGIPGAGALISAGGGGGGGTPPPPCDPPKRPHVEVVLDSSGTAYNVNLCLPEGAKIGRYSWRELSFD